MKKTIVFIVYLAFSNSCFGQGYAVVIDAKLVSAIGVNLGGTLGFLNPMATATEEIKKYQETIMAKTVVIRGIEELMYNSLFEVSAVIKDGKNVASAALLIEEIGAYQADILENAKQSPELNLIAIKTQAALLTRSADLVTYIYDNALVGGDENLLSSKQRMELIRYTLKELRILRGIAFEVSMRMTIGSRAEAIKSVNLFDLEYPDNDEEILEQVLKNF